MSNIRATKTEERKKKLLALLMAATAGNSDRLEIGTWSGGGDSGCVELDSDAYDTDSDLDEWLHDRLLDDWFVNGFDGNMDSQGTILFAPETGSIVGEGSTIYYDDLTPGEAKSITIDITKELSEAFLAYTGPLSIPIDVQNADQEGIEVNATLVDILCRNGKTPPDYQQVVSVMRDFVQQQVDLHSASIDSLISSVTIAVRRVNAYAQPKLELVMLPQYYQLINEDYAFRLTPDKDED